MQWWDDLCQLDSMLLLCMHISISFSLHLTELRSDVKWFLRPSLSDHNCQNKSNSFLLISWSDQKFNKDFKARIWTRSERVLYALMTYFVMMWKMKSQTLMRNSCCWSGQCLRLFKRHILLIDKFVSYKDVKVCSCMCVREKEREHLHLEESIGRIFVIVFTLPKTQKQRIDLLTNTSVKREVS